MMRLTATLDRLRQVLPILVAVSSFTTVATGPSAADESKSTKVRIVLVGDSTVTDAAGWGKAFGELLTTEAECVNRARGGASSKSYYDKGLWKLALEQKPDYVLIQFGHNDQPGKGPDRETDPKTTYREYLNRYLDEARKAGARPILVTSLTRRTFGPDGKIRSTLVPYVEAMKSLAAERQVPLVDLHARSTEQAERLGVDAAKAFGPPHPQLKNAVDGTHLNAAGAKGTAPLIVDELKKVAPELAKHFVDKPE